MLQKKSIIRRAAFLFAFFLVGIQSVAQVDSSANSLKVTGYAEVYYAYDLSQPATHLRPAFLYSYNRHNEVNLNLGFIKFDYRQGNVRAKLALMAGTYAQYNLASEHPLFQHIFEATVGTRISKQHNLWVDAGIMPSHIGFESAVGKTCWTLSRSILADNSPYYLSGIRIGYTGKTEKLYLAGLIVNGWQRIKRIPYNQTPAFGTQLNYKPTGNLTLNWSTFAGNEFPDTLKKWRYFNNFYGIFNLTEKFGLITGFDIGLQQRSKHSNEYNVWYTPIVIARISPYKKVDVAVRAEYFNDPEQVVIQTFSAGGFQTMGYSVNFDYTIRDNCLWRIEGRIFNSHDSIFLQNTQPAHKNYAFYSSFGVTF